MPYFIKLLYKRPLWIRILFIKLNVAELVNQSIRLATAIVLVVYFCALFRYFFVDCTESEGVLFTGVMVQETRSEGGWSCTVGMATPSAVEYPDKGMRSYPVRGNGEHSGWL
jgi:hypothetical protein